MAATRVQGAAGTTSATYGATPTAGNVLVAVVQGTAAASHALTGWTQLGNTARASGAGVSIWVKTSAGTEGTVTPSGGTIQVTVIAEWSGVTVLGAQYDGAFSDTNQTSTAAGTSPNLSLTTTKTAAVVGTALLSGAATFSPWSPALTVRNTTGGGQTVSDSQPAGTVNLVATWGTARLYAAAMATIYEFAVVTGTAAGPAGTTTGTATGLRKVLGTASGPAGTTTGTALAASLVTGIASGPVSTVRYRDRTRVRFN